MKLENSFDLLSLKQNSYEKYFIQLYKTLALSRKKLFRWISNTVLKNQCNFQPYKVTSTGIDADASKGETSPGYLNSKLVHSYKCGTPFPK